MTKRTLYITLLAIFICFGSTTFVHAQDRIPREYTNPDEVITFDRSTSFTRALDVINQFAQDYAGKVIIDRTDTDGNLGITVPAMHWRDALSLILRSKYLELIERRDFFEIIRTPTATGQAQQTAQGGASVMPDTALTTGAKEVRINAIFFEGNRRALQEIGVDWSTLTDNVPGNVGEFVNGQGGSGSGSGGGQLPSTQQPSTGTQDQGFDGPFVSVNSNGAQSVSQNVFNSLINFGEVFGSGIRVQALFSAFEADNIGEILASPNIKVLEGEQGRIQVGQDFSIKQRDFAGNVTDQFFSVGTILEVTPQVIEQQDTTFIHLDIEAERSSAQPDPVSTIINKQNANTQALLLDDEATVIAGLYRTEGSEVRRGVPILKDLPPWFFGLRYVFGYNSKDYQTRELVILIQASIEPGIPERMDQDRLPNKLETLKRERIRMQGEIEEYRNEEDRQVPEPADDLDGEDDVEDSTETMRRDEQPYQNMEEDDTGNNPPPVVEEEIPSRKIEIEQSDNATESEIPNTISKTDESFTYYVVGGSFKSEENANQFRRSLERQGYDSEILVNVEDGFYMVTYKGFDNKSEAMRFLRQIKSATNTGAWIYDNF